MEKKKIKVGYLPLYIKLYDDTCPEERAPIEKNMHALISMLEEKGLEIVLADDICRTKDEFDRAAKKFNADEDICAVITQHLAYSPSLEAIEALLSLKAPIIVFDTTMSYGLLSAPNEDRIMPNHGIHGVQDMCCMLKKSGKKYSLCVGHIKNSNVIDEVISCCRAAYSAKAFGNSKIGIVGYDFEGMGDFVITDKRYKKDIGADVIRLDKKTAEKYLSEVTDEEINDEVEADKKIYNIKANNKQAYYDSTRCGLAVRHWIEKEGLDGFTANFLHADDSGLTAMPFVECCKALANNIGYAGEGDKLTAGLVSALMKIYPDKTTFTEMFCPDWERDVIMLSHMGEINPKLTEWKPDIVDMPFNYNTCTDTTAVAGGFKSGKGILINLAPMNDSFTLILTEVEIENIGSPDNAYGYTVQGWMKPCRPIAEFLKEFSYLGGTHHSAFVYDADIRELSEFGKMLGFDVKFIK